MKIAIIGCGFTGVLHYFYLPEIVIFVG